MFIYLFFLEYSDHDQFLKFGESFVPVADERGVRFRRLYVTCGWEWGRVGLCVSLPVHWVNMNLEGEKNIDLLKSI